MTPVIAKIQKLLALAEGKGASPTEAANAAAAAQALMEKHHIERADLDTAEEAIVESEEPLFRGQRRVLWRDELAAGLAYLNACETVLHRRQEELQVRLIGRDSDIAVVRHLFVYLSREIDRLAKTEVAARAPRIGKRTWANNFRLGAVGAVLARLRLLRDERRRMTYVDIADQARAGAHDESRPLPASQIRALVELDMRGVAVKRFCEARYPVAPPRGDAERFDARGRRRGREAAQAITIADAITTTSAPTKTIAATADKTP